MVRYHDDGATDCDQYSADNHTECVFVTASSQVMMMEETNDEQPEIVTHEEVALAEREAAQSSAGNDYLHRLFLTFDLV